METEPRQTSTQAHQQWLADRKTYLGGTDAAAIVGENPYKTPLMVWREKKGLVPDFDNAKMRFGRERENHVIRRYMEQTGHKVRRCRTFRHPKATYFGANPDGLICVHRGVLECKTGINHGQWGDPGTDQVPRHYLIQGVWYLGITERPFVDFAFEDRETCQTSIYRVFRDEEYEELLFQLCNDFHRAYIETDIEPPASEGDLEDITAKLPTGSDRVIAATQEIEDMVYRMIREKATAGKLYSSVKNAEAQIKMFMGDASALMGTWGKPITWKNDRPSIEVDFGAALCSYRFLAAGMLGDPSHPVLGLLDKCIEEAKATKAGSRRFLIPKEVAA